MKRIILIWAGLLTGSLWAQTRTDLGQVNNWLVVSTPCLDTLWIQTGGVGDLTYRIWQEDPCPGGPCPVVIQHPDLALVRRRLGLPQPYRPECETGMLISKP
jgi:hypothetical protein